MLLLLVLQIVITLICTVSGVLFYSLIGGRSRTMKSIFFYPFSGLIVVAMFSQAGVLFVPVDNYFSLGYAAVLVIISFFKRREIVSFFKRITSSIRSCSWMSLGFFAVTWLMILVLNSGPVIMDDTDSYHLQMVKWISEYGSVPGIANLHERFGFNSSWFSAISFFNFIPGRHNFYVALNGTVSCWTAAFLITKLRSVFTLQKDAKVTPTTVIAASLFIFLVICWPMLRGNATNTNYDFIATALVLILFFHSMESGKEAAAHGFDVEWILWPVFLFTVRIMNAPLLLLTAYGLMALAKQKQWKQLATQICICVFLVAPFLARNVILSGYPFYPATYANIFQVDWKVDKQTITKLLDYIKYYNRVGTAYLDINHTRRIAFPDWIYSWFHYLFSYDKWIVIFGGSGYLINLIMPGRFLKIHNRRSSFFILVCLVQLALWMMVAPDPRFVYGELLCGVAILVHFFWRERLLQTANLRPGYFFVIFFSAVFLYSAAKVTRDNDYHNFLLPSSIPQPPTREVLLGNVTLKIPEKILNNWNPRCYATDLPCLYIINPKLEARGATIKNGFRLEK